jgi:hypothetical protein
MIMLQAASVIGRLKPAMKKDWRQVNQRFPKPALSALRHRGTRIRPAMLVLQKNAGPCAYAWPRLAALGTFSKRCQAPLRPRYL